MDWRELITEFRTKERGPSAPFFLCKHVYSNMLGSIISLFFKFCIAPHTLFFAFKHFIIS